MRELLCSTTELRLTTLHQAINPPEQQDFIILGAGIDIINPVGIANFWITRYWKATFIEAVLIML